MAVGGVLEQRQLGRVTEDLIERERRVALGGDDDLRPERRVLVGHVGVARQSLMHEVARQRPARQRFPARREPQPVGGGQRAVAEELSDRVAVMGVDDVGVRGPERVFAEVPLGGPVDRVGGDPGQLGHPGAAEVAGLRKDRGVQVALMLKRRVAGAPVAGVGEMTRPVDFAVGLDQQLCQRHDREPSQDAVALNDDRRIDDLGGERAQVQLAGVIKPDRPVRVIEQHLELVEVAGHLRLDLSQALGERGGLAGQLQQIGPVALPHLGWDQVGSRVGVAAGAFHPDLAGAQSALEREQHTQLPIVLEQVLVPGLAGGASRYGRQRAATNPSDASSGT